jgi:predicted metalloprotease with PDZ domain
VSGDIHIEGAWGQSHNSFCDRGAVARDLRVPAQPPLRYTLAVESVTRRLLRLTLVVPGPIRADAVALRLPSWSPGSYMVREYARHVRGVEARDSRGRALRVRRDAKDRWTVAAPKSGSVRATWLVYANELSVRTCHVDDTHAFVQPTAAFLCPEGMEDRPLRVEVRAPRGWEVATSLLRLRGRGAVHAAADQEALHDAPIHMGLLRRFPFRVRGVPHEIALWGEGNEEPRALVRDFSAIVEAGARIFGGLPYDRFVVHGLLAEGGGGLEHRDGFVFQSSRWGFRPRKAYDRVLALLAHEFFHAWNVRRIRPEGLLPYDLSKEKYTRLLWQFEGVTSYYEALLLRRAGLWTRERALESMAERMSTLLATPGRREMDLAESSVSTWVKFYRPDEDSGNSAVSYYLKGSLAGLALDLHLRARTRGRRSYDDVMRRLWRRHRRTHEPVPEDGMAGILSRAAGVDASRLHRALVEGTGEIDWEGLFRPFGVRVERLPAGVPDGWKPGTWLGVEAEDRGGRTILKAVRADGPAAGAVAAGDELVALDGLRTNTDSLAKRLAERKPGERVRLTLLRGDRLLAATVRLAAPPVERIVLKADPKAPAAAKRLLRGWLGA